MSLYRQRSFIAAKSGLLDLDSREKVLEILFRKERHLIHSLELKDTIEYTVDLEKLKPGTISEIYEIVHRRYVDLCSPAI